MIFSFRNLKFFCCQTLHIKRKINNMPFINCIRSYLSHWTFLRVKRPALVVAFLYIRGWDIVLVTTFFAWGSENSACVWIILTDEVIFLPEGGKICLSQWKPDASIVRKRYFFQNLVHDNTECCIRKSSMEMIHFSIKGSMNLLRFWKKVVLNFVILLLFLEKIIIFVFWGVFSHVPPILLILGLFVVIKIFFKVKFQIGLDFSLKQSDR